MERGNRVLSSPWPPQLRSPQMDLAVLKAFPPWALASRPAPRLDVCGKRRCKSTWSEDHDFLQPLHPWVPRGGPGRARGPPGDGDPCAEWCRRARGPQAGRSAPRTALRARSRAVAPRWARALPPQCTAAAPAGGGDPSRLSSSLVPAPARCSAAEGAGRFYCSHPSRKDGRGSQRER